MKNKKESSILLDLASYIYTVMIVGILGVCIFFQNREYGRKNYSNISNIPLLIVGIFLGIGVVLLFSMLSRRIVKIKITSNIVLCISIVILVIQIFCIYDYFFYTDWDVKTIMDAAQEVALANISEYTNYYYSVYPNNLFLVFIFSRVYKMFGLLHAEKSAYFACLVLQSICSWIVGLEIFSTIRKITGKCVPSWIAYGIYVCLVMFSPWISIPYSDSIGLFFPMTVIWIYIVCGKNEKIHFFKWLLIGFLAYAGYRIKPQTIIIIIAIILVETICIIHEKKINKKIIKKIVFFLMGGVCSIIVVTGSIKSLGISVDKEKTFGFPHFLMMGMNTESQGVWDLEDVLFSSDFKSADERKQADIEVAKMRIKEMGCPGLVNHFVNKTLINYNDGTFCWGGEGVFYYEFRVEQTSKMASLLRNIYYNRDYIGKYYPLWSNFEQAIWITTLLFSIFAVLWRKNKKVTAMMLSIIGLTIFELLFEARARYLFTYTPVYIILGTLGLWRLLSCKVQKGSEQ